MTQPGAAAVRGTLPVELTQFIGRERELRALHQLARTARLITLTGAGGSGKSRLALELVRGQSEAHEDVAWVELAPLMESRLVPGAVLRALGAPTEGGPISAASIIAVVREQPWLIVLDNCEHLVDTCADLVDALLRGCPNLRIIATSREALGVAGERAWLVPPLTLPAAGAALDVLAASDAVRLFIDRARDVLPDFDLTRTNAATIAAICTRLDGIPLAIELAAARVRHMSPEQIQQRLGDAFALLTTGARTALPRHRTLRATLDWSHDLLPEPGRIVLRRLSVFRGGLTLELAERVAAGDGIEAGDVLDIVAMLADRSMIVVREHRNTARYHLLETMRQYAMQRLEEAGEADQVRRRHAEAVIAQVSEVEPDFTTPARSTAFAQLEPELDNIRDVLSWTHEHDPEQHVRLVGTIWWFWFSTLHLVEAHRWITGALALPAAAQPSRERAAVLFAAGALAALRAQAEHARPLLEEAAALAARHGDSKLEAYAYNYLAMTWASSLSPRGMEWATRAEQWTRAHGDLYGLRLALLLGGMAAHAAADTANGIAKMEEAIAIARAFGQDRELAIALQTLATVLSESGDPARAEQLNIESLEALRRDPAFLFIARALDYHAYCRAAREPERAARTLGIAAAIRQQIGASSFAHDQARTSQIVERLRAELGAEEYDRCFADGTRVQPVDAIDDVLGHEDKQIRSVTPTASAASAASAARQTVPASPQSAHEPAVDLDVRALGTFEVAVRGRPIDSWPHTKPREMLAALLLEPHGRTRAEIGAMLWPDAGPAQTRNSFHVTLHYLRKTLGHPDWIVAERDRYRLAPDLAIEFDVHTFQRQVKTALSLEGTAAIDALRAALSLYHGHFLSGETTAPWRDEVQDRLRRTFCDAALRLGALLDAAGDLEAAIAVHEAILAGEPLHEDAHRALLLALTRSGRRAHAVRHIERFTTLLAELELEPEDETLELYARIRSADITPTT